MKLSLVKNLFALFAVVAIAANGAALGEAQGAPHPRSLKVLMIGNSFSVCCVREMPWVARSLDLGLDLCSLYIGGCSLKRHCDNIARADDPDFRPYQVQRVVDGNRLPETRANIPEMLKADKWDVVTIQQCSHESWIPESYHPAGDELVKTVRALAPQAKIYVQETWSYTPWDKRLAGWKITPDEMYTRLHAAYAAFARGHDLPVIPMGTAVQRWRRELPVRYTPNSLGGDVCGRAKFEPDGKGGFKAKGDVFHLNHAGDYLQALVWTATLFGVDVTKCSYAPGPLRGPKAELMKKIAFEVSRERAFECQPNHRPQEAFEALLGRRAETKDLLLPVDDQWALVVERDELLADWILQDAQCRVHDHPLNDFDPVGCLERALRHAGVDTKAISDWPSRFADYRARCLARRAGRLARLVGAAPKWAYCRHHVIGGSHYAYTEAQSDARGEHNFPVKYSALCLMEATAEGFWRETVLKETTEGCYRDVDVSFDGKRLLYAYKASARGDDFHLYEMDLATRTERQLTFGKGFADYEACYLPSGEIVFNSTRCVQIVDCAHADVSNLFRCDADGANITRLTYDQVHDNFPTLAWDDRILYTRWEYNDRSQIYPQPLFGMSLDGTNQRAIYGDNSWWPTTLCHARVVPQSPLIFAIATGHHSFQPGELVRLDPREGRQEDHGAWAVAPLRKAKARRVDADGQLGSIAAYPYPLDENELVLSYLPEGWPYNPKRGEIDFRFYHAPLGLYWFAVDGSREQLLPRRGLASCGRAVPVRARAHAQARPSSVDRTKKTGTVYVQDVYVGEAMAGVKRGTVKTLRVVALDYRPVHLGGNGNHGPGGGAYVTTPVALGQGAWDPKIPVGDAVVEEDGSAFFTAPSEKPFYFMLLDEKGRMVQTMRSWTMLQPGENASCTGCHEFKNDAPPTPAKRPLAFSRGPQPLKPVLEQVRGLSFRRDVQPILDRRCVSCHGPGGKKADFDLTAARVADLPAKRFWTKSYLSLTHASLDNEDRWSGRDEDPMLNWICAASEPTVLKPYHRGSNASRLFKMLDAGHAKGITADELARLAMWVDLAVPFCGTYDEEANWTEREYELYERLLEKRARATQNAGN